MKPNKVIGLTGSIASGKSTAASILKKEYGIFCIDADQVGHEILEDPKVKARLLEAFGPDIFRDDRSVNRKALGDLVFEQEERLETLNQITHPTIIASIEERLQKADTTAPFLMIEAYGLLQTDLNLASSEIIATYVYKKGLLSGDYSFSTAVGLFNTVINVIFLLAVNQIVKRMNEGQGL